MTEEFINITITDDDILFKNNVVSIEEEICEMFDISKYIICSNNSV